MRACDVLRLVLVTCGFFFVGCDVFPSDEVKALTKFKESINGDPFLVLSNWNASDSDPCHWKGISCSKPGDHVIKINISGASLKGVLAPDLYLISYLEELILHGNLLVGEIPKEIGLLKGLKVLDLGANQLTGPIPPEIGNLSSVKKIILQSNGLTGSLPPELGDLKYLEELRVDRNKLEGIVPASNDSDFTASLHGMHTPGGNTIGLCCSSQLKVADFSFNFLSGIIPKCLSYLPSSSFQGNCLQVNEIKQRPAARCASAPQVKNSPGVNTTLNPVEDLAKHRSGSKPTWLLVLEVVTGILAGTLFFAALLTAFQKCKKKPSIIIPWKKSDSQKDHLTIYVDTEMLKDVARYSRQELEIACEDFSNIIGSSPDSLVYKGTMKGGPEIAVISLCANEEHWSAHLELYFQKEVAERARINHENTAKLLGYCTESSPFTRMLVFEYASNGTLYEHLHYGEGCQLSWTRRMNIIIGIAKGLKYLHTELNPPFTICELNSNSVYLTEDFSPKLVDFESWKTILSRSEKSSGSISSEGAVCVLSSSLERRHLDVQGNIYAFGVLLLEIVSGRPPYCKDNGSIVDWAKEFLEVPEVMSYVVDPELKHFRYEDLKIICDVVNLCIHPSCSSKTSMSNLCNMLLGNIDTSVSVELRASSLAWAELALS
ncbi:probable LRR receptor-like serine/threonine-protein kinase At1g63430 [Ipomoea triloba]|uniref:probable LRR receptor-like serine/threonine-protein kinase At1g63430 n=1 Tax=Ipomoea triloba TaxID=35885 RepID=UPI00125CEF83|nr:probable LRR receptor-like serine/threonine-protein kinase At1g63430 [Ipomoea triloba]